MDSGERHKDCSHYGIDYRLSISFSSDVLSITAEEKLTGVLWKASLSSAYIEELTRKTGNQKRFGVFVRMLVAAMEGSSRSVLLEVVSQFQMEAIRAKKRSRKSVGRFDSRVYLILTYTVEFDKVHYPLPLTQEELAPAQQALIVRQLRAQLSLLKSFIPPNNASVLDLVAENARLREELLRLREVGSVRSEERLAELERMRARSDARVRMLEGANGELKEQLAQSSKLNAESYRQEVAAETDARHLRNTVDALREQLRASKSEAERYRELLEDQSRVRSTRPESSRYVLSPDAEEVTEPQSLRVSHQRLMDSEDEEGRFAASAGESIENRLRRMKDFLTQQAIL